MAKTNRRADAAQKGGPRKPRNPKSINQIPLGYPWSIEQAADFLLFHMLRLEQSHWAANAQPIRRPATRPRLSDPVSIFNALFEKHEAAAIGMMASGMEEDEEPNPSYPWFDGVWIAENGEGGYTVEYPAIVIDVAKGLGGRVDAENERAAVRWVQVMGGEWCGWPVRVGSAMAGIVD